MRVIAYRRSIVASRYARTHTHTHDWRDLKYKRRAVGNLLSIGASIDASRSAIPELDPFRRCDHPTGVDGRSQWTQTCPTYLPVSILPLWWSSSSLSFFLFSFLADSFLSLPLLLDATALFSYPIRFFCVISLSLSLLHTYARIRARTHTHIRTLSLANQENRKWVCVLFSNKFTLGFYKPNRGVEITTTMHTRSWKR